MDSTLRRDYLKMNGAEDYKLFHLGGEGTDSKYSVPFHLSVIFGISVEVGCPISFTGSLLDRAK
jgi:hypothetical protein